MSNEPEWHEMFLWWPMKLRGRWFWLRRIERMETLMNIYYRVPTQGEVESLRTQLAEAKLDVTRYAFLRNLPGNPELLALLTAINADPETPDEFDAVIDAAIAKTLEVFK